MENRQVLALLGVALFLQVLVLGEARAGESASFEEVRAVIPEQARRHLEASYAVAEVGSGLRLGRHFVHLGGARIGPYDFTATSKQSPGLSFDLTVHTEVVFLDASGQATDDPKSAQDIRETFESYSIVLTSQGEGTAGRPGSGPAPGGKPMPVPVPGPIPVPVATPVASDEAPLDAAGKERVVTEVRAIYGEVDAAEMETDGSMIDEGSALSGNIVRSHTRDSVVRRIEFDFGTGDHGGYRIEMMCDRNSRPAFVLWQDFYWQFKPGSTGETIDEVSEWRYYFSPGGQLAKALEKSYSGSGEEELAQRRDSAKNKDFQPAVKGIPGFHAALAKLPACSDAELEEIAEALIGEHEAMLGRQ